MTTQPILSANNVWKSYNGFQAVRDVSLSISPGETLGLVGESGCGKSTTTRMLLALESPDQGQVMFKGEDIWRKSVLRHARQRMQLVPQNPQTSFNPRLKLATSMRFALKAQGVPKAGRESRIAELFLRVGLKKTHLEAYPHQLSGGQLQRAAIARALGPAPDLLICDEAVSALDKSVQAQVLNLLAELQSELNLSMLFISHDLGVVEHMSDRVMVMNAGQVVETGDAQQVYDAPQHAYTRALLASVLQ